VSTVTDLKPTGILSEFTPTFTKYVMSFGVAIVATESVSDSKLKHSINILAQYLDNDMDGFPDNQNVTDRMAQEQAVLMMTGDQLEYDLFSRDGLEKVLLTARLNPDMMVHLPASSVNIERPEGLTTQYDQSLKGTLQLVAKGFSLVYPDTFGQR